MLKADSSHRAGGGYLVLPIEELLREYYSWDTLKRSVRNGKAMIEELSDRLGFVTTKTLRPQPIPLNVKVLLVGRLQLRWIGDLAISRHLAHVRLAGEAGMH